MGIIRINPEESSAGALKCVCMLANDFPLGTYSTAYQIMCSVAI